jgi:hypothetical protein
VELIDIFRGKATHLCWAPMPHDHVWTTGASGALEPAAPRLPIEADEHYFVVRLAEMYVEASRKLWRKLYPVLHAFVRAAGREESAVAGPSQLRELGEANLDRIVNLDHRLAGPTAYRGGDLRVLVGLYAVPGEGAARALVDTVGALASLGGIHAAQATQLAGAVKAGIERIVGLDETRLQLGVDATFPAATTLSTGYHVGIGAPAAEVPLERLWLRDGRLLAGDDPVSGLPFDADDYLVISIERVDALTDWPALPGMADMTRRISLAMSVRAMDEKRARLREVWPEFQQLLDESPYLTRPDRLRIAGNVLADLQARLARDDPFAPRVEHRGLVTSSETSFDLAGVEEGIDLADAAGLALAERALAGAADPFAG